MRFFLEGSNPSVKQKGKWEIKEAVNSFLFFAELLRLSALVF